MLTNPSAKQVKERIHKHLQAAIGKGLEAARAFLVARIKEELSTPAPKQLVRPRARGGIPYYRALTKATPGAPPRMLSGYLRQSVSGKTVGGNRLVISANVKSLLGFKYGVYHEKKIPGMRGSGKHPFVIPTIKRHRADLKQIVTKVVKAEFSS